MQKLERAQNKALRIVTGQYNSTPVGALLLESGIVSYKTHSKRLTSIAAEKAERLPPDHPRNIAFVGCESLPCFWSVSPGLMSFLEEALVSTEKLTNPSEFQS